MPLPGPLLLTLATGIVYFVFVVTGLSLSAGLAVLIVGLPFFLVFIRIARVLALGEGRLLEAIKPWLLRAHVDCAA